MSYQSIIITIGDELLIGQTIDTNSAWIAQQLNHIGINVKRRIAVADERSAIATALDESIPQASLILLTGGLGPTADDITKPLLSEYFDSPLIVNETVLQHVKQIFTKRNRPFLERNLKQAEVPENCQVLFNRLGTAPGMWFEKEGCIIISLPGVPFEMQTIMSEEALPRLKERLAGNHIIHKTMIVAGVGESFIADKIEDIETALPPHIHLAYLPTPGYVKLRLTTEGPDRNALQSQVDIHAELIRQRLGTIVAAMEDLLPEEIVARLMEEHRLSLSLAESCTGGYLANRITNLPGSSAFFKGSIISYDNEVKESLLKVPRAILETAGAVSEKTVIQMAEEARRTMHTDIALSISGILGPGGGTAEKPVGLVWMAISDGRRTVSREFHFFYDRLRNKEQAANAALDMIRLFILDDQH
ncbi:competence/damage-inducible protein A [Taibaiella koreensis]|uniref:competence/damage-inducible protein A n=1 Tax=Taibaiella koreensis TaxID=1268548 RepID=UPI000E59ED97|nr:competence/damage-inducible protein A [Taibaiella koreensis]